MNRLRLWRGAKHVSGEARPISRWRGLPRTACSTLLALSAGLALITAGLLSACTASSEHPCPTTLDAVRDHVVQLVDAGEIPSMVVAVSWHGKPYWEEAFGWANREERIPATVDTRYALASVSKPLTATAFMILVDRGLFSLEDPVNAHLGENGLRSAVADADGVTFRQVASHTAGLPLHCQTFYVDEPFLPPSFDETIRRYGFLATAPGERYQYSNLGYGILGHLIGQLSGGTYAEFLRDEVLDPLGMEQTTVGLDPNLAESYAVSYTGNGEAIPTALTDCPGSAGLYGTASDLIRFARFHMGVPSPDQRAILSEASRREMQTVSPGTVPTRNWECPGSGYGLGWFVGFTADGLRIIDHSGGTHGVSTILILIPEEELAVVALSNASGPWPEAIGIEIVSALIPERLAHLCTPKPSDPATAFSDAEPNLVGRWSGSVSTYEGNVPISLQIDDSEDARITLGDAEQVQLRDVTYTDRMPVLNNAGGGPFLRGWFESDFGTEDVRRGCPCKRWLELKLRDQRLTGSLITFSQRLHYTGPLSHWVELTRAP